MKLENKVISKEAINQRFTEAVECVLNAKRANKKGEISSKLSFNPSTFSEILSNRTKVSAETIAVFCYEYGVNSYWILTGEGEMLKREDGNNIIGNSIIGNNRIIAGDGNHYQEDSSEAVGQEMQNELIGIIKEKDKQIDALHKIIEKLSS